MVTPVPAEGKVYGYASITETGFFPDGERPSLRHPPTFEETSMAVYMVERSLPGIAMSDLAAAQKAAIATSQQFTADGTPVRYIRSTFLPDSGACMCLFEAGDAESVARVNKTARIPYDRIVPALDLTP